MIELSSSTILEKLNRKFSFAKWTEWPNRQHLWKNTRQIHHQKYRQKKVSLPVNWARKLIRSANLTSKRTRLSSSRKLMNSVPVKKTTSPQVGMGILSSRKRTPKSKSQKLFNRIKKSRVSYNWASKRSPPFIYVLKMMHPQKVTKPYSLEQRINSQRSTVPRKQKHLKNTTLKLWSLNFKRDQFRKNDTSW